MATLRMSLFYSSVQPRNAGKQTEGDKMMFGEF